jgi:mitochondrial fission protein ELM1
MKLNPSNSSNVTSDRLLILSDGKPGHVNQSIAFARHLGADYDIGSVRFNRRWGKACSYLFARLNVYSPILFTSEISAGDYSAVVSAGSGTYYATRTLARQLRCKAVAIMLPRGYPLDFDLIVAQQHDDPSSRNNIITIPINLTYVEPQGLVVPQQGKNYLSLIIGGDSQRAPMNVSLLKSQLEKIFSLFPDHKVWLTTSRRTPVEVEEMLQTFNYERAVFYSQEPINPIPDFLQHSDYVFLTADSSSMVSEAVSFGQSCVEILPLSEMSTERGKLNRMLDSLSLMNCLHLFDGGCGHCNTKISLVDLFATQIAGKFKSEL